jgi:hypothetical protein
MKKLLFVIAAAGVMMPAGSAIAHPTGIPFATRGACEVAYEQASKDDRDMLVALGIFDTKGAAQMTFNNLFECEYDSTQDAWFIVYIGPPGGPG